MVKITHVLLLLYFFYCFLWMVKIILLIFNLTYIKRNTYCLNQYMYIYYSELFYTLIKYYISSCSARPAAASFVYGL